MCGDGEHLPCSSEMKVRRNIGDQSSCDGTKSRGGIDVQ